jgi:hypothetical protein
MANANRPKSSIVGIGDFALSTANYRKMKSIENLQNNTISTLEDIMQIQRVSMSGIISLHNEIEELSRTQWHILDHLTNMENKEQILGNLKLILVHTEEQFQLIEQMSREYPEFAALLSMNLKNMLEESDICMGNLKMMSIADIKWAKQVLDGVNNQYILLHSNSETIELDKVMMLEKYLEEISDLNESLIGLQGELEEGDRIIETLGKENEEYVVTENEHKGKITNMDARIESLRDLASILGSEIPMDEAPAELIEILKSDSDKSEDKYYNIYFSDDGNLSTFSEEDRKDIRQSMKIRAFDDLQSQIERIDVPASVKKLSLFFRIILPCLIGIYWYFFAAAYRGVVLDVCFVPIIILLLVGLGDFIADMILIQLDLPTGDPDIDGSSSGKRKKEELTDKYQTEKEDLVLEKRDLESLYTSRMSRYNEIEKRILNKNNLNQKIEGTGNDLSKKWASIQHLVPNNSDGMIKTPAKEVSPQVEAEKLVTFVSRWEELPDGKWLDNDENGVNWYIDIHGHRWYSDQGGFQIWEE